MTRAVLWFWVLLIAACSTVSPRSQPRAPLVEVRQTGGMCPDGRCDDRFTVWTDGTWRREVQSKVTADGRLSADELAELRHAVETTALVNAPAKASTACPAAADGVEVTYVIGNTTVSSCRHALPADDPLPRIIEKFRTRSD